MNICKPKENVEYTFIFSDRKIYSFILDYQLPNGRYRFKVKLKTGKNSWYSDMDVRRFSYLHKYNRDKIKYPDVNIKKEDDEDYIESQKIKCAIDTINKNDEQRDYALKCAEKKVASELSELSTEKKNICKQFNIKIDEVIAAVLGKTTKNYPKGYMGVLKLQQDLKKIDKITGLKTEQTLFK